MNRRDFLRGLLAIPLAPLAARLLPEVDADHNPLFAEATNHSWDLAKGSDQTTIYLVDWAPERIHWVYPEAGRGRPSKRNWLKESLRA